MKAAIVGLGEWHPDLVKTNEQWPALFARAKGEQVGQEFVEIDAAGQDPYERILAKQIAGEEGDPFCGAKQRRIAPEHMTSVQAEVLAARCALEDAQIDHRQIDIVLTWSVVPDRIGPPSATAVAYELGLTPKWALGIDVACASTIAQLDLATQFIATGAARYVLCTQSHLMTRATPMLHPASPTLGDCTTAFVVGPSERPGVRGVHSVTHGDYYDAVLWCRGRAQNDTPWWKKGGDFLLGSHDVEKAKHLVHNTVRLAAQTVRELMDKAQRPVEQIDVLASVQPRRWIPPAVAEVLGLSPTVAVQTFDRYTHLGGCGVIVNLLEARRRGLLRPGSQVVLYAQGAGFTRSAALIDWV